MKQTRTCEVCGKGPTHCTNSRCEPCHRRYCTPGGNDYPGHGRGNPPADELAVKAELAQDYKEDR